MPLVAILERPQHTPPQSAVERERRAACLGFAGDRPGRSGWRRHRGAGGRDPRVDRVQHSLARRRGGHRSRRRPFSARLAGEMCCGDTNRAEVVPTNRREPPVRIWSVTAPPCEGTYVLEVSVIVGADRRPGRPAAGAPDPAAKAGGGDQLERAARGLHGDRSPWRGRLGIGARRPRNRGRCDRPVAGAQLSSAGGRPIAAAEAGRFAWAVPPEALIEPSRRDRLRGWFMRQRRRRPPSSTRPTRRAWPGRPSGSKSRIPIGRIG